MARFRTEFRLASALKIGDQFIKQDLLWEVLRVEPSKTAGNVVVIVRAEGCTLSSTSFDLPADEGGRVVLLGGMLEALLDEFKAEAAQAGVV